MNKFKYDHEKLRKYIAASDILYQMLYKGYWEFITIEEYYRLLVVLKHQTNETLEREINKIYAKKNNIHYFSDNDFKF